MLGGVRALLFRLDREPIVGLAIGARREDFVGRAAIGVEVVGFVLAVEAGEALGVIRIGIVVTVE